MIVTTLDVRPAYAGALFALLPEGAFVVEQIKSRYPGFIRFRVSMQDCGSIPAKSLN